MWILTAMLVVAGTAEIKTEIVGSYDSFGECAVQANATTNLIWHLSAGNVEVLASTPGMIVLTSEGHEIALTCEEKEAV